MVENVVHDVMMVCGMWLLWVSYQQWQQVQAVIKGDKGEERKRNKKKKEQEYQGKTKKPVCVTCDREGEAENKRVPPSLIKAKRGRKRKVETSHHYCPD